MQIASAASAFPKHYYSQKFLLEQLQEYWGDQLRNPQLLARLHRNVSVEGRHLAMSYEKYYDIHTWGRANDIWIEVAQELGRVPRPVAAIVKTAIWEGLELPMERALELERHLAERVKAAGLNRGASRIRKGRIFPAPQSGGGK